MRARRRTSRAPSSGRTRQSPGSRCAPGAAGRSSWRRSRSCSPRTWGRSSWPRGPISMENTHNFAGGAVTSLTDMQAVRRFADERGVGVHIDGARLWNAHVATGVPLSEYAATADVLAVCLSKGLGAPIGSLVVGDAGRDRRGPGLAQAPRRRHATGRGAGGGRSLRARPPPRTAGRRPRERPAARGRRAASTRQASTRTSWWSTYPTRRRWWPLPASTASWSPRSVPARFGWSRTSTCRARTPRARQRCSPRSSPEPSRFRAARLGTRPR